MGKQADIPGTERASAKHKDLVKAAEDYIEKRDERMALTKLEVAAKLKVIDLMKKYEIKDHIEDDIEISLKASEEKLKVKRVGDDASDDDE
jgi:hypothetical protein